MKDLNGMLKNDIRDFIEKLKKKMKELNGELKKYINELYWQTQAAY